MMVEFSDQPVPQISSIIRSVHTPCNWAIAGGSSSFTFRFHLINGDGCTSYSGTFWNLCALLLYTLPEPNILVPCRGLTTGSPTYSFKKPSQKETVAPLFVDWFFGDEILRSSWQGLFAHPFFWISCYKNCLFVHAFQRDKPRFPE